MDRKSTRKTEQKETIPVMPNKLVDCGDNAPGQIETEELSNDVVKSEVGTVKPSRGPTSMWKLVASKSLGKKVKVRYDGLGRALYEDYKQLQSYIGHVARSMVSISINNWRLVPKDIKKKLWEEISNTFEVVDQTRKTVLMSASQKWRDWKVKLTNKFVWPFIDTPEKIRSSLPEEYKISATQWKEFLETRLDTKWRVTHLLQMNQTKKMKYRHMASRKGYIGVEADIRKKEEMADDEEIDRSKLWVVARQDGKGNIPDKKAAEVAKKIDVVMEDKANGKFIPEGSHDVLIEALGTVEKYGRVRGIGRFVKPQVFFGTAQKTRSPVAKALANSLKQKTEDVEGVEIEAPNLTWADSVAFDDICDATKSKKYKAFDANEEVGVEVGDNMKGKACKISIGNIENVVAFRTIISAGGANVVIHHRPLGKGNWKVAIDGLTEDGDIDLDLPILDENGPLCVADAVGCIVAWPKNLVVLESTHEKKEEVQDTVALESGDNLENVWQPVGVWSAAPIGQFKIQLDEALFGVKRHNWLVKGNIFDFMEMKAIGQAHITIYMGHLFKYLKEHDSAVPFAFVDPTSIPGDGDMSGNGRLLIERLNDSNVDNIFLILFNTGGHWILTIINDNKENVYFLDSLGNRTQYDNWKSIMVSAVRAFNTSKGKKMVPTFKQLTGNLKQRPRTLECGFCVCRYMKEIIESDDLDLEKMYGGGPVRDNYYSQAQYDEVLDDWSEFVYSHLI
ncbi:hypothetical protein OROMI_015018 [Orobanche minor]